mgnify:CR=1 FL=1
MKMDLWAYLGLLVAIGIWHIFDQNKLENMLKLSRKLEETRKK